MIKMAGLSSSTGWNRNPNVWVFAGFPVKSNDIAIPHPVNNEPSPHLVNDEASLAPYSYPSPYKDYILVFSC